MGLLTDTVRRRKILNMISAHNNKLCLLCYIVGVGWFLALAYYPVNAGIYVSENALLPGLVEGKFNEESEIHTYYDQLKIELEKDKKQVPQQWLFDQFTQLGLDVYVQNFSLRYPLKLLPEGQVSPGQNVYAILRAPRAASTEAVVLTAPFRPLASPYGKSTAGIALMLVIAKYFRRQTYWAKDIIFLVTEHEHSGMLAWLDGYHGYKSNDYIITSDLEAHSGSIQAAINLEIPLEKISHMNLKLEGLNGQMPNLDLVNLAIKLCKKEGVRPLLHRREDHHNPNSQDGFLHSLRTMLKMMWFQATGMPSGNHGLFHKYHIEAVTLEGIKRKSQNARGINSAGRIVEGIFRSLNNLLERFHQSFFFYLLPSTTRYVSIGLYMPPFGLLVAPSLIKAIALWVTSTKDDEEKSKKEKNDSDKKEDEKDKVDTKTDDEDKEKTDEEKDKSPLDAVEIIEKPTIFSQVAPLFIISLFLGIIMYNGPHVFAGSAQTFRLRIDEALMYGLSALFVASLTFPKLLFQKSDIKEQHVMDWEILKCLSLICQSLVLFSVALMNISLGVFLAVTMVPAAVIVRPVKKFFPRQLQSLFLLITSPPSLIFIASVVENIIKSKDTIDIGSLLLASINTMKEAIFIGILDNCLIGNWMYTVFSFAIVPCWLLIWTVSRIEI